MESLSGKINFLGDNRNPSRTLPQFCLLYVYPLFEDGWTMDQQWSKKDWNIRMKMWKNDFEVCCVRGFFLFWILFANRL